MVYIPKLSACRKWLLSVYQNILWKGYTLPLLDVLETVTSLNRMSLNPVRSAKVVCPFCHVTGSWALFSKSASSSSIRIETSTLLKI
jgi:hypothetical protein